MVTRSISWRILLAALFLILVIALPAAMAKKARKKDSPKRLYAKKCAGACHRLYKPQEYTKEQWIKILDEMSTLAKLTREEHTTIEAYLLEHSAGEKERKGGSSSVD